MPGDIFGTGAEAIDATSSDATADFALDRGYTVSGAVHYRKTVVFYDGAGAIYGVASPLAFDYTSSALPPGTYYARTFDTQHDTWADLWYQGLRAAESDLADATPIVVTNANVTGIDFGNASGKEYDQVDPHIVYTGTWSTTQSVYSIYGSYTQSSTKGASITMWFDGIRLHWGARVGPNGGKADIYLDDSSVPVATVDEYYPVASWGIFMWSSGPLPRGLHKLRIVSSPSNAAGTIVTFDYLWVDGVLVDAPPAITGITPSGGPTTGGRPVTITGTGLAGPISVTFGGIPATGVSANSGGTQITCTTPAHVAGTVTVEVTTASDSAITSYQYADMPAFTKYDQTNATIVKTGVWADYASPSSYGGSYGRSSTSEASATIWFNGAELDCIAMKGTTTGVADIYLDGATNPTATVDLAASPAVYQQMVWSTGPLTPGLHSVRIVRSGSSVSGKYLTLDAVDVAGTIAPAPPSITGISPSAGSVAGGTSVTISGVALGGATSVTFDGLPATNVTANPAGTQITCTTPAHAAGLVTVVVTTPTGTVTTSYTFANMPPVTRYDATDPSIKKTGTWAEYLSPLSYLASYGRSATAGASATIWFTGTRLDYIAMKGTTTGYADVYLDGIRITTINLSNPAGALYQQNVWSSGPLANGLHSVKIVRSASSAIGKYLVLDAVDIYGTIAAPPTRYEQANRNIHKVGVWADYANATASGGYYGRSSTADASATIHFTGSRIDYIGFKGTTTGVVDIYLDGDFKATIDLAATSPAGNLLIWSSGTLGEGPHTFFIHRNGSSAATEFLTLDAVDIWGSIAP